LVIKKATMDDFCCLECPACDGKGCIGQLPGMGGANDNRNFILNCSDWAKIRNSISHAEDNSDLPEIPSDRKILRIGPVTGAVENFGFSSEYDFKFNYVFSAYKAGLGLCTGDGYPDIKLQTGIGAIELLQKTHPEVHSCIFLKPYSNEKILERIKWSTNAAEAVGIEIDWSLNKNFSSIAHFERKTAAQLLDLRKTITIPFALKGIFLDEDIELVKEVKPDIAVISNEGGRIDTRIGSTAEFLATHGSELKKYCGEIWVDGGIRNSLDIRTALALGASQILTARPFITALFRGGTEELCRTVKQMLSFQK
jgi:4-hydroxymandelate oxidase